MVVRKYESTDEISVGDVIRVFDGAFGDGIIKRIEYDTDDASMSLAIVDRPMAQTDWTGGAWIHCEQMKIHLNSLMKFYPVYVRGTSGAIDNRNYPR